MISFGGRKDRKVFTALQIHKIQTGATWRRTEFEAFLYAFKYAINEFDTLDHRNTGCNHENDFNKYTELRHSLQQIYDIGIILTEHIKSGPCLTVTGERVYTVRVPISRAIKNKIPLNYALGVIEQMVLHVQDCRPEFDVIDYESDDEEYISSSSDNVYHNTDDYYNDRAVTRSDYEKTLRSLDDLQQAISNQLNISKKRHIDHAEKFTLQNLIKLILSPAKIWRWQVCIKTKKSERCEDGILIIPGLYLKFPYGYDSFELDLDFNEMKMRQRSIMRDGELHILSKNMNYQFDTSKSIEELVDVCTGSPVHVWIDQVRGAILRFCPTISVLYGIKLDTSKIILVHPSVVRLFQTCKN